MRITSIHVTDFKRFSDLTVKDLSATARLVIRAGPNGSGKSSLFDAFLTWYAASAGRGFSSDARYYDRSGLAPPLSQPRERVAITFDRPVATDIAGRRKLFYVRSAYRNEPAFILNSLQRSFPATEVERFTQMIASDVTVSDNYQRIASQVVEDTLLNEPDGSTFGDYRARIVGEIRQSMLRIFPDLTFAELGNPMDGGTFRFDKGAVSKFDYKNLSGGEKAAFDLVLDVIVKRRYFDDTIYCIDEPEAHMNARIQGRLLEELVGLIPDKSQLWLATHSIGMMRKARQLSDGVPGSVAFLDFSGADFDTPTTLSPIIPTRAFWESALAVAVDDLSELVAPKQVVVCEGSPAGAVPGKNASHDAICYNTIFANEFPDTKFLSGGGATDVVTDRLGFVAAISALASGIHTLRLIDRDDHGAPDIAKFNGEGIRVLGRRHIESYLFDDEVLTKLCEDRGMPGAAADLLRAKADALAAARGRGNPPDDVKSAAGDIYNQAKRILGLTGVGNDAPAFMRQTLSPLVQPGTAVYTDLRDNIFGP